MIRAIRFGRFGMKEDPTGQIVSFTRNGPRLAEVTGYYLREFPQAIMLRLKHFNGEDAGEVAASSVRLVLPDSSDETEPNEA